MTLEFKQQNPCFLEYDVTSVLHKVVVTEMQMIFWGGEGEPITVIK